MKVKAAGLMFHTSGFFELLTNKVQLNFKLFCLLTACSVSNVDKSVRMECSNDTLTVTYPTDLVFGGDILTIPDRLRQRLVQSLNDKGLMMTLVDTQRVPP